jgi:hypothetical protein
VRQPAPSAALRQPPPDTRLQATGSGVQALASGARGCPRLELNRSAATLIAGA